MGHALMDGYCKKELALAAQIARFIRGCERGLRQAPGSQALIDEFLAKMHGQENH